MVSNPEREGFVRPAQAAFSSTVSQRRRASACSDASASFEPCRQVVDVLETTGRQLSSWHINTLDSRVPLLFRQTCSFLEILVIAHFSYSSFVLTFNKSSLENSSYIYIYIQLYNFSCLSNFSKQRIGKKLKNARANVKVS